ncbi:DUF423 domain-containing protein [Enemella dayhoffiae]|uniref:DUF423 domain-containing protein n=1 Tax=Enemella dayhoffiae TaxID=2016507 RepID=A0A255H4B7_9ACTN|nr:DUF423 domain-containing protein [Enemella dayhoffiae]OYO21893.1 DUF423 domain-containing protein [Enemella dayhoffiae]
MTQLETTSEVRVRPAVASVRIGAVLAAVGVALGAFASHALKDRVTPDLLAIFETGVRYQMYAALAILVLGALGQRRGPLLVLAGTAVFSGSLYLLALSGVRWLGAITPIGGVLLIVGLLLAAVDAGRGRER